MQDSTGMQRPTAPLPSGGDVYMRPFAFIILGCLTVFGCVSKPTTKSLDPEYVIRYLTADEREQAFLRTMQQKYPKYQTDQEFLRVKLKGLRTYNTMYEANLIKLRYQYPQATAKELHTLADDETMREMERQRDAMP